MWALILWVIVLGSIVPFTLFVGGLRHVSATRVGIAAMLEPVVATIVAWAWLEESLSAQQLAGAAVVLVGILWLRRRGEDQTRVPGTLSSG